MSQHRGCGWSACSLALMESVDIADWPAWLASGGTFGGYKQHVTNTLLAHGREDWGELVARHSAQVPYRLFQPTPSLALFEVGRLELTWEDRLAIRRWCHESVESWRVVFQTPQRQAEPCQIPTVHIL